MSPGEKSVALSWYLALMTATCLDMIGAQGPSVVEGPFARNALYAEMLTAATGRASVLSTSATGTSSGAALLADQDAEVDTERETLTEVRPELAAYAEAWKRRAATGQGPTDRP